MQTAHSRTKVKSTKLKYLNWHAVFELEQFPRYLFSIILVSAFQNNRISKQMDRARDQEERYQKITKSKLSGV